MLVFATPCRDDVALIHNPMTDFQSDYPLSTSQAQELPHNLRPQGPVAYRGRLSIMGHEMFVMMLDCSHHGPSNTLSKSHSHQPWNVW